MSPAPARPAVHVGEMACSACPGYTPAKWRVEWQYELQSGCEAACDAHIHLAAFLAPYHAYMRLVRIEPRPCPTCGRV